MCGRVVIGCVFPFFSRYLSLENSSWIGWQFFRQVNDQRVFLFCIRDFKGLTFIGENTLVADLSATFGIKGGLIKN